MIIKIFTDSKTNDIFRFGLDTESATSYDYIAFISDILNLCRKDINSFEKEANKSGRTIKHCLVNSVGSIPKDPQ